MAIRESSAGAVIFRRDGNARVYLLLHYQSGHWDFVKGHIESGESERETIVRETKEETGIEDLSFVEGFRETIHYFFRRGGAGAKIPSKTTRSETVSKDVIFLLAETQTPDVTISHEHIGFEWLPYEEAVARLTFKTGKQILEKAEAVLRGR